jgi:hypothetical protein
VRLSPVLSTQLTATHWSATEAQAEAALHSCVFNRIGPRGANRSWACATSPPYGRGVAIKDGGEQVSSKIVVVALLCAVVALAACRREERFYEPMKLGADMAPQAETAR